jgi:hypothetical protein
MYYILRKWQAIFIRCHERRANVRRGVCRAWRLEGSGLPDHDEAIDRHLTGKPNTPPDAIVSPFFLLP